jgi:hypothetical protein
MITITKDRFLVEVMHPMSTKFTKGMLAWCRYVNERKDFQLTSMEGESQSFGFAYNSNIKIIQ